MSPPERFASSRSQLDRGRRRWLSSAALLAAATTWGCVGPAKAVGGAVDVQVIDRDAGSTLEVYAHGGRSYVAGRPGARYALRVTNRTGGRVLAVMSVDGVNILSGQTADWGQNGYVLSPGQTYEITGWRKSEQEVAAFEFTSLPDAYATRTGRPHDVGVIGVAVFSERVTRPVLVAPPPPPPMAQRANAARAEAQADSATAAAPAAAESRSADRMRAAAPEAAERLGTGHGAREASYVSTTHFVRQSSRPLEVVSLQYDRFDNLLRAGVVPQFGLAEPRPRPFPRSAQAGPFVPDPPLR